MRAKQTSNRCLQFAIRTSFETVILVIAFAFASIIPRVAFCEGVEVATSAWLMHFGVPINAAASEEEVLESLYRRGLYQIAVDRCEFELRQTGISRLSSAQWTSRLITSLAARDSSSDSIDAALKVASKVAEPYLASSEKNKNVNILWIEYAFSNARFLVTDRHVAAYLAAPANQNKREDCLASIRNIIDAQMAFQDEVQATMSKLSRLGGREANIDLFDLAAVKNQSLLLQLNATLLRARLYAPKSDDAVAAAAETITAVERALDTTEEKWTGRAALELARCDALRMVGRTTEAMAGLGRWITDYPANALFVRASAIGMDSAIDLQDLQLAENWFRKIQSIPQGDRNPELAIAQLKWMIFQWQIASKDNSGSKSKSNEAMPLEEILKKKDGIAKAFGNYWGLRAEAVILASNSNAHNQSRSSIDPIIPNEPMALIKLQIKQLLAANRIVDAVDRLRQSESIASKSGDQDQAFEFAKLQIGLLMRDVKSNADLTDVSRAPQITEIANQVEATAMAYFNLPGADELHRLAEPLLLDAWKLVTDENEKSRYKKLYEQHLVDHLERWPLNATSVVVREQIVASYLVENRLADIIKIWHTSPPETPDREIRLLDGMLLFACTKTAEKLTDDFSEADRSEMIASLSGNAKLTYRWLTGDWSWWPADGGIDSPLDSGATTISLISLLKDYQSKTDGDTISGPVESAHKILSKLLVDTANPNSNSQLPAQFESEIQKLCQWIGREPANRMGWGLAISQSIISILDSRIQENPRWLEDDSSKQIITKCFLHLSDSLTQVTEQNASRFHPKFIQSVQETLICVKARVSALNKSEGNSGPESLEILLRMKAESPRNPRWSRELALIHIWMSSANKDAPMDAIEKAILVYKELAAGNRVGSDGWFDARIRLARYYQIQNKREQAVEAISLCKAMARTIPEKWKPRIAYLERQIP